MKMIKNIENAASDRNLRRINKDGKVNKKDGKIPIEMKKYRITELSALQKKFAKVEVELSFDD